MSLQWKALPGLASKDIDKAPFGLIRLAVFPYQKIKFREVNAIDGLIVLTARSYLFC